MTPSLIVDAGQISRFVRSLFKYAPLDCPKAYVSLRAFPHQKGGKPLIIKGARLHEDGLDPLVAAAVDVAQRTADSAVPGVFAPPICLLNHQYSAAGANLLVGLTLSVELDESPAAGRRRLESILGPATIVVASGGTWTDPDTGEIQDKLHVHYRLSEPTTERPDHDQLRHARALAMRLVGADPTAVPIVHCLKWPGSWNRKTVPRMSSIIALNEDADLHLVDAIDVLEDATALAGIGESSDRTVVSGEPQQHPRLVSEWMQATPNVDAHYNDWIAYGYRCWRAMGGDPGFDVWNEWSKKSAKYDAGETEAAWHRICAACANPNAPRKGGAGTIAKLAMQAGWTWTPEARDLQREFSQGQKVAAANDEGQRASRDDAGPSTDTPDSAADISEMPPADAQSGAAEDTAEWPAPFFATRNGVWYQPPAKGDESKPDAIWICAPFEVVAETADEAGGSWGLLLRWRDRDKRQHDWAMPRRLLHADGNQIAAELEHAGLSVGTGKVPHDLLKRLLAQMTTPQRRRCVTRSGWHHTERGNVYVLPSGETFGPRGAGIILQTEHVIAADTARPRGTLSEWQEHVAKYASGNHRFGLACSVAFAAPLLDVTTEPSGGLHLHGGSQTGKTTLLGCAASIWGRADTAGQIRTWRATSNGMEGVAAETCDALLPLDEIGMVDAREAGDIVYSLANESGKARAARDGSARVRRTWRTVFLSTGEVPLSVKMGERGGAPMAGQEVRLANIPAAAGAGFGVFQTLHGFKDSAALAVHLREGTRSYYGTAARHFLEKLAHERETDPVGLLAMIDALRAAFLAKNLPAKADGQVISVARRFALFAAAGELARMFGVLPWEKDEAQAAAASGFRAWIAARGGVGADEDAQAVATVRRFIEQHEESRFSLLLPASAQAQTTEEETRANGRQTVNRVGFRRQTADGWQFLIFPESWKAEVCRGIDHKRAAEALHEAKFLDKGEDRNWAKKHRVPGLGVGRFYTVDGGILRGEP